MNYERDYSHSHCWDNKDNPCGIPLEKHTQCCLCDMKSPHPQEDLGEDWEKEFDDRFIDDYDGRPCYSRSEIKGFIRELLNKKYD